VTGQKGIVSARHPTIAEAGVPGYDVTGWYGMARRPGRDAVIERLNVTSRTARCPNCGNAMTAWARR